MRFAVDGRGRGDHAGVGIDREQSVGVAGQAVGDRVVGRIQIEGIGGDTDGRADDHVFVDFVRRRIGIGRHRDIELIQIVDRDVERLTGDRTVAAGRLDRDRASRAVRFAIDRRGGGHHAGVGVDLEQSVGVAGQAVGDRVVGRIQIEGIGRHADGGADDHILVDFIGRAIDIGRHRDIELIQIVDGDVERLTGDRTVAAGRLDRDRASRTVRFAVDGRGGGHDAGVGIDLEQSVRVAGQAVGDRVVGRIQVEGIGGHTDGRADDHVLVDFVGRADRCRSAP